MGGELDEKENVRRNILIPSAQPSAKRKKAAIRPSPRLHEIFFLRTPITIITETLDTQAPRDQNRRERIISQLTDRECGHSTRLRYQ